MFLTKGFSAKSLPEIGNSSNPYSSSKSGAPKGVRN